MTKHSAGATAWRPSANSVQQICYGVSEAGHPLTALVIGDEAAPYKIAVIAGQHGDEVIGCRAAADLIDSDLSEVNSGRVQLAVIACVNPDGRAMRCRSNRDGIDLNRDHRSLKSSEIRSLHAFLRSFLPDLLVDVHTYPPRRRWLTHKGLEHVSDVYVDWANAVPLPEGLRRRGRELAMAVIGALNADGFIAERYFCLTKDRRVRHSTKQLIDARNGLALRLDIPTLLLEGREPTRRDFRNAAGATRRALVAALKAAISIQAAMSAFQRDRDLNRVALRSRRELARDAYKTSMKRLDTGLIESCAISQAYLGDPKPTESVELPAAYAIHAADTRIVCFLQKHGFSTLAAKDLHLTKIPGNGPAQKSTNRSSQEDMNSSWRIVPTQQLGGRMLAVLLEQGSPNRLRRGEGGIDARQVPLPMRVSADRLRLIRKHIGPETVLE